MTGVDLHPEDLLEREGREGLLPAEKDHLERHLRQCTACRFERLARDDFQKESDASDEDIDVHRLLARVLVGHRDGSGDRGSCGKSIFGA